MSTHMPRRNKQFCQATTSDREVPVPVATACSIALAASERHRLKKMAWGHRTEYQLHVRAHIVLHAARGLANARIAERVGVRVDTVRRWRGRFAEKRLPGLADRKRTGRPPPFTPCRRLRSQRWCATRTVDRGRRGQPPARTARLRLGPAQGLGRGHGRPHAPLDSGPVAGHVNRIKMLKRQMFGRAKLDLLRKRVLLST